MIRRLAARSGLVFALVFTWKLALLIFTSQPIPANDSFFYDGAVVNLLNGGGYFNPSLALALPISGREVFCAYPPLYQIVLLAWMGVFGTSALAAMWLHLVLFGLYLLVLLAVFRRLKIPPVLANLAGLFLFVITFQDRPDSLAHLLGILAIYAWVRATTLPQGESHCRWDWLTATFVVLTLATSLQIGAMYLLWIWALMLATSWACKESFPLLPMAATVLVPGTFLALVKLGFPHLWEGFMEHALQTPTVVGWRLPRVAELLKALRTAPGVIATALFVAWFIWRGRGNVRAWVASSTSVVALTGVITVLVVVTSALLFLSPNFVLVTSYPQPLIVASFLAATAGDVSAKGPKKLWITIFIALAALGAVRAVGMSTWGVACAMDVNHQRGRELVRNSLNRIATGSNAVLSSAFLYEAARHRNVRPIHSDWLGPARRQQLLVDLIKERKPTMLILTQFDYYRRYIEAVHELQEQTALVGVSVTDAARTPPPDASPRLQKVVQHISWAPVIVELSWK